MAKHTTMSIDTLMGLPPNRIEVAVGRAQALLDGVGEEKRASLTSAMALSFDEFVAFQNAQALAHASGRLTADEAMAVYTGLGGESFAGDWPAETSLALRVTITQLMGQLMRPR